MGKGITPNGVDLTPRDVFSKLKAGAVQDGNYFEVEEDGTWVSKGDATTWKDIVSSLIGRRLTTNPGTLDYDWEENAISMSPSGNIASQDDRAIFNVEYNHDAKTDGTMHLHVHWEQPDATERTFTVQYRIQSNNTAKNTTWTTINTVANVANNAFPYVSGTLNQITSLTQIDMSGAGLSPTVQFRFTRSDANAGDILATFVDSHVEIDTSGSREEFVK